jgi:nucleoside-diphosphate-sugar epimerase
VRNHFIQKGLALVPWDDDPDFCLIGAGLEQEENPPLAQLELQKMQVEDLPVLLLSVSDICILGEEPREENAVGYPMHLPAEDRSAFLYAMAAEHLFLNRDGRSIVVRPFNVYGPDITWGLVHDTLSLARKGAVLVNPKGKWTSSSFIHQEDFLKSLDLLLAKKADGIFNVGSPETITYVNLLRNIWKFVNGGAEEPNIAQTPSRMDMDNEAPCVIKLHKTIGWLPGTSLRSRIFKMVEDR